MKPRVAAIIESRMSSRRLPGKNLKPILGVPMLGRLLERLKRAQTVDAICVATSTDSSDDVLESFTADNGVACHRGSLEDVLARVLGAAQSLRADVLVEITGDCPLVDPAIIDAAVRRYRQGGFDYVANILDQLTFPVGFDVQIYATGLLDEVSRLTREPYDRNNVTPFIYHNPDRYRLLNLRAPADLDRRYWLCVDDSEDFALVTAIYTALFPDNPAFTARDVVRFVDAHPELLQTNLRPDRFVGPSSNGKARQEMLELP